MGLSETTRQRVSEYIAARIGLNFPPERHADLERGLERAARDLGLSDAAECAEWLLGAPHSARQIELLASHLTIGETYFLRDERCFELLETEILPELIARRLRADRRLRLWSAGCSSGEEAYSLAISVCRLLPDLADWSVTILGTDINRAALRKAEAGVYGKWSFRGMSQSVIDSYFQRREDGLFELIPRIKRMVTFELLNLAEDIYPSLVTNTNAMDVIFCRNVLMYFAPEQMRRAVSNLQRSLIEGGWLVVSPSELSHLFFSQFLTVNFAGATLYRKSDHPPPPAATADNRMPDAPLPAAPPRDLSAPDALAPDELVGNERLEAAPAPSTLLAARSPEESADGGGDAYQEALLLYDEGRYEQAAGRALEIVGDHPSEVGDHSGEARADRARALVLLARARANEGRLDEAEAWCERAIVADRLNPGCYYLRATIAQERGRFDEARSALRQALYLDPDFALAHFAAGNLARQRGYEREAARHFAAALELLDRHDRDDPLPEGEGLTAGRLREIIRASDRAGNRAGNRI